MAMSLPKVYALTCCGGLHRSASAAVAPDGGSNWMVAGDLEPFRGVSSILAVVAGPPVFFLGAPRVPDAFWTVRRSDANDTV